jgi:hypothetical protein
MADSFQGLRTQNRRIPNIGKNLSTDLIFAGFTGLQI